MEIQIIQKVKKKWNTGGAIQTPIGFGQTIQPALTSRTSPLEGCIVTTIMNTVIEMIMNITMAKIKMVNDGANFDDRNYDDGANYDDRTGDDK